MIRFERGRTHKLASSTESRIRDLIEQNKTANNPTELLMLIIELMVLREEIVNTFKGAVTGRLSCQYQRLGRPR